jgi:uncharacterized protein (DUF2141 family)
VKRALSILAWTCLAWLSPSIGATQDAPVKKADTVTVDVLGVDNAKGQLLVALFRDPRGFPDDGARAWGKRVAKPHKGNVRVVFDGVPPGPYAVSVHHDEDADFEMDLNLLGMPTEGYGFSRDAHAPFGPPSFEACRELLKPGTWQRLFIHLRY